VSDFDDSFAHVLGVEGDYSNNPFDSGGPTKYGITQDTLSSYRGKPCYEADVKNLSLNEAKMIYRARYWNTLNLDDINNNDLATVIFEQAVNRGAVTAAKQIQNLCGVKEDGMIGPKSIESINLKPPLGLAFKFICASQESYCRIVQKNPTQAVFITGWIKRTHKLLDLIFKR